MNEIEANLLTHRTIYLNLSLKERTIGLNDIIKDLSSFFKLNIYFWNLSKQYASVINIKENTKQVPKKLALVSKESIAVESTQNDNIKLNQKDRKVFKEQSFEDIISSLIEIYETDNTGIYIIENINQLISSDNLNVFQFEQLKTWILKLTQKSRQEQDFYIILLGNTKEKWDFQDIAPVIKLPYLNIQEISSILKNRFEKLNLKDSDEDNLINKASHILSGITLPELNWGIDNITNSLTNNTTISDYIDGLLKFKQQKLKNLGLSFLPPPVINNIGGMDVLKKYIDDLKIEFSVDKKYNIAKPQGWLLVGVPGSGKSLSAKVLQMKLSMPMIHVPIEEIKGRGPQYLAEIFKLCEANAPNIVYIDELDKLFPDGVELNEIAVATLGVFLTWLQEKEANCFVLATLNRLDNLPPELLRAGRFSEIFYVGFPQPIERKEIFLLHLKKFDVRYEEDILSQEKWRELIDETIKFTGAEIAQVVEKSYRKKVLIKTKDKHKLETKLYEYFKNLIELLKKEYSEENKTIEQIDINLDNLDSEINKFMTELPNSAEAIDKCYAELLLLKENLTEINKIRIDELKISLNQIINSGYQSLINKSNYNTINLNNIDDKVSQALVDLPDLAETINKIYDPLNIVRQEILNLDAKPIIIDYDTILDFCKGELPLFEKNPEKVMAIENRARGICTPVASEDNSNLTDKEPTFWPKMSNKEAQELIARVRKEHSEDLKTSTTEEEQQFNPELEEYKSQFYWA